MSRKKAETLRERLDRLRALGTDAHLLARIERYAGALVLTADDTLNAGDWLASARECLTEPVDMSLLAALALNCPREPVAARDWGAL